MWEVENGTNGWHVAVFSVDVAFAHHFRSASGIGYASKKLSKMAGNSASYPLNS